MSALKEHRPRPITTKSLRLLPHNLSRTRAGFTLIEMMIVVLIIGVMAKVSVPRIGMTVARSRISGLEIVVASQIERAFALATRTRRPVTVTYDSSTAYLITADRASSTQLQTRYLGRSAELSVTSVTLSPTRGITIFPSGLADSALTVTIGNNGFTRYIRSTVSGLIVRQ